MILGVCGGGWHAGTTAQDTNNAPVTSSSFPWSPAQPSSLVLLPVVSVAPGAGTKLLIHTPPLTVGIWDVTTPPHCYPLYSSNQENMLNLVST